ncbi:MAG: WGR domain-containing protein [Desulfuromonadales bacterium]|nr:WGR domain-containing protein [Desulfuromonadales bacterium]
MALHDYGKVEVVCIDPQLNRRRYYCVSVEAGLFGPILVRSWGRIGWRNMRQKMHCFVGGNLPDALKAANQLIARKLRKGYEESAEELELHI